MKDSIPPRSLYTLPSVLEDSSAHDVGGTSDRNSLSARQANGAAMLGEVDAAAVAKLLLVWFIAEFREVFGSLLVRNEVEQPQKLAMNAPRGMRPDMAEKAPATGCGRLPAVADLVSGSLVRSQGAGRAGSGCGACRGVSHRSSDVVATPSRDYLVVAYGA